MLIDAYFAENGLPKINLSPTISIYDMSDGSLIIDSATMQEIGSGFYVYNFSTADDTKRYSVIADSIILDGSERYAIGSLPYDGEISSILDQLTSAMVELTETPPATPTLVEAIMWLYMKERNVRLTTSTEDRISNDAGTVISESNLSDDGSTFIREKYGVVD